MESNNAVARDEVTAAAWLNYAEQIAKIEKGLIQAGATRISKLQELSKRIPVLNADMFEKNFRKPLRYELEKAGIADKSIPAIVSNTKVALLAMTNGIMPQAGETNILGFVKEARKALVENGILEASKRGRSEGSGEKTAPQAANDAKADKRLGAIEYLAGLDDPTAKQHEARASALAYLIGTTDENSFWSEIIGLANSLQRRNAA